MTRDFRWWMKYVVHNCLVHPILPIADALESLGFTALANMVYAAHDRTVPPGGG